MPDLTDRTTTPAAPEPLDPAGLEQVLRTVADRLTAMNPNTAMSPARLHSEVQLAVWDWHRTYMSAVVGRDITLVLTHVRDLPLTGTRAEYATRLRMMTAGVTL